ncbi:putative uncharacterized protein [Bacteroides finegoldii CAG:203]|jgi:hypothetical protein|uniref:hypothetical protein n=2 Tax=Bacteroides TaxID=816 RepID=UPI00033C97D8|nr:MULTISPECIES: hypothetical protein [Bacteroides]MDV7054066.1 hypothetical protein [Bacteroides ovatus]CDC50753.1 putative uncharacterized protein [Bacteroides finegoldii CAG:203]
MSHTVMSEDKNKTPQYYPRKMRRGWCVAHEVTAAGVTIERYGIRCQTYAEAYHRAEVMNREQQAEVMNRKEPLEAENTGVQTGETTAMKPAIGSEKGGERL